MKRLYAGLLIFMLPLLLGADKGQENKENMEKEKKAPEQKVIQAVRAMEPIEIDGLLTEKVWQRESRRDFIQSDPVDGGTPTEKTEVWVA